MDLQLIFQYSNVSISLCSNTPKIRFRQVLCRLAAELESVFYVILDMKRVMEIDECAATLLEQMNRMLAERHKKLILAHCPLSLSLLLEEKKESERPDNSFFSDSDSALGWCENRLLYLAEPDALRKLSRVPLRSMEIVSGLGPAEIALLESIVEEIHYRAGEVIIREGDTADSLFLLAAGLVSVRLRLSGGARHKRLSTITPGLAFGELALLDGGTRSADVIADESSVCYVLRTAKLNELAVSQPEIRTKLILNIGRELSARLRQADAEIRSLAE